MVKKILYFAALAILLAACSSNVSAPEADTLPVLVVDEAHFQDETLAYEIPAGNGFVLDAANYTYQIPAGASRDAITADQLLPLTGASEFGGFGPGHSLSSRLGI